MDIVKECPKCFSRYGYNVEKLLGKGGYASVYRGIDKNTGKKVAIKVSEGTKGDRSWSNELLFLNQLQGIRGIPKLFDSYHEKQYYIIITELLGESLKEYAMKEELKITLKDIAFQTIDLLKDIHDRGIVHRDVSMLNLLFGLGKNKNKIYLIDFGLSEYYLTTDDEHVPYEDNYSFRGTYSYSSPFVQMKIRGTRRDDMISLGYSLAALFVELPWKPLVIKLKKIDPNNKKKRRAIQKEIKNMKFDLRLLRDLEDLPESIYRYIKACFDLEYEDKPKYKMLKGLFAH